MRDLVVYGVGELGQLYGAAALRAGIRVTPITRASAPDAVLASIPGEVPVLVAVGEDALDALLSSLPKEPADRYVFLQNDLFPQRYEAHGLRPTVLVAWLLKKRGTQLTVARASSVYGRHAKLVCELHEVLGAPAVELASEPELRQAIVEKYAFILGINALGLLRDRTLARWRQEDPLRVRALTGEAAELGARLCSCPVDQAAVERAVDEAFQGLASMSARGRTAEQRVRRALDQARELGLALPELTRAAREAGL